MLERFVKDFARGVETAWQMVVEVLRLEWLGMDDNMPALYSREGMYWEK